MTGGDTINDNNRMCPDYYPDYYPLQIITQQPNCWVQAPQLGKLSVYVYNFSDDGNKNPSQTFCLCKYLIGDPHGRYQYQYFNISSFDNTNIGSIFYNLSNINVKFLLLCSNFPNVTVWLLTVSGCYIDSVFQITEITARQRTIYYPEIKASH